MLRLRVMFDRFVRSSANRPTMCARDVLLRDSQSLRTTNKLGTLRKRTLGHAATAQLHQRMVEPLDALVLRLESVLEVDDVDLVTSAEDELIHLGVPVTALVAEMDARAEHIFH